MIYKVPSHVLKHPVFRRQKSPLFYTEKDVIKLLEVVADNDVMEVFNQVSLWCDIATLLTTEHRAQITQRELITVTDGIYSNNFFKLLTPEQRIKWIYHMDGLSGDFYYFTDKHTCNVIEKMASIPMEMLDIHFMEREHCIIESMLFILAGYVITQQYDMDVIKHKCHELFEGKKKTSAWYKVLWLAYLHGGENPLFLEELANHAGLWIETGVDNEDQLWGLFKSGKSVLHKLSVPLLQLAVFEALSIEEAVIWVTQLLYDNIAVEDTLCVKILEKISLLKEYPWDPILLQWCLKTMPAETALTSKAWLGIMMLDSNTYSDYPIDVSECLDLDLYLIVSTVFEEEKVRCSMTEPYDFDIDICVEKVSLILSKNCALEEVSLHW